MNQAATAPAQASEPIVEERPRVVAVDDQPDSLRLLQLRLEAGGIRCFPFSDGPSALKFLETQLVDVVILDVMMPKMDGYEVCRRIKADERLRDLPVIFLTARLDTADKVKGLDTGGHDYLSKPIQQAELLARTRAAIRVKQLQDELKEKLRLQAQVHQLHQGMLSQHWQRTLGQLAASLAHEINNPLAAALGTVQLLNMQGGLDGRAQQSLNVIDRSLQRVSQKLRSLLLITHGREQAARVDLAQLLLDLVALVNYQAVMYQVTIKTDLAEGCFWKGAPGDLGRAILYLLNNAFESVTGKDEATATVTLRALENSFSIGIADNGGGIPPEVLPRIFEPFFTTKGIEHSGVGLFLAAQIVDGAGGKLGVQSPTPTAATEFTIRLPARTAQQGAAEG